MHQRRNSNLRLSEAPDFRSHDGARSFSYSVNTLPGFIMFSGSSARLMARIVSTLVAVLLDERLAFALADSVLAGAGSLHADRAIAEALDEGQRSRHLLRVRRVDHQRDMEIAVADMADDRRDKAGRLDVLLGLDHAIGEPRNGNADVGRQELRSRPQGEARPIDVVARLPQPRAIFRPGGPFEIAAAPFRDDLAEHVGLFAHALVRAVEFDK